MRTDEVLLAGHAAVDKRKLLAQLLRQQASRFRSRHTPSPAQQELLLINRLDPASTTFHLALAVRIVSEVDVETLRAAAQYLVDRHATLRSLYGFDGETSYIEVHGGMEVAFEHVDASSWTEEEVWEQVRRRHAEPFDLEKGPILRVTLLSRAPDEHVFLFVVSHIACDGLSMGILLSEFIEFYGAERQGVAIDKPPLSMEYTDYLGLHREALDGEVGARHLEYWLKRLSGDPPHLDLPTDRPQPPTRGVRIGVHRFSVGEPLYRKLEHLARAEGTTMFAVLMAAYQVFLMRLSGQTDILVGVPMSGRVREEYEAIVGHMVNGVIVRSDLSGNPTFRAHLRRVWRDIREAAHNQEYSTQQLQMRLGPAWQAGRVPLFQVSLNLVKTRPGDPITDLVRDRRADEPISWGPLRIEPYPYELVEDQFDLAMNYEMGLRLIDPGHSFSADIHYDSALFDAKTIQQFERSLTALMADAADRPDVSIDRLEMLGPGERRMLLDQFNADAPPVPEATLPVLFEAQAGLDPAAVAVTCGAESLSYGELNARANRLAHHLIRLGVGPETLVAVCLERSTEMVVALLGILKAGGAYLPLDPEYPPARLSSMLDDAAPRLVLSTATSRGRLPAGAAVLALDEAETRSALEEAQAHDPTDRERAGPLSPQNAAYVIYTSGSTGTPKGVIVTHANVVRLFGATRQWFDFGPQDVTTLFHSYAFDFSVWELWGALLYGGRLVVVPRMVARSPAEFLAMLVEQQVTVLSQTPSAFYALIQADAQDPILGDRLCLRQVIFGGEALDLSRLEPWYRRHASGVPSLVNMYGITETTVHVTYLALDADLAGAAGGSLIGGNIPDLRVYVLDDWLEPVPVGVAGELYVAGAGLARGYLRRPGLTAERFVPDPHNPEPGSRMYRTGDRARWRRGGTLEFLGRADNQVKIRGFRIELGDIEASLARHAEVARAAVVAREDGPAGPQLVAYVVPTPGATPNATDLRSHVAELLPEYMVPSAFVTLADLPLTVNGKLDRKALPAPRECEVTTGAAYVAPRNQVEADMAAIWAEVLQRAQVGIHDDFFEIGGHSLMALHLFALIQKRFRKDLPVASLFLRPTVAQLSELIGPSPVPGADGPPTGPGSPRWARLGRALTQVFKSKDP